MLNIAHRGASGHAPENTLAAFAAAIAAGADMCELDLRATRDGVIVVLHDATVDRTTNGTGEVAALTFAELRRWRARGVGAEQYADAQIPTLDEVFDLASGRCALNLELKAAGIEAAVAAAICTHNAIATTLVSSFDWPALAQIKHLAPRVAVGLLADREPARLLAAAIALGAAAINPRRNLVSPELTAAAHRHGIKVYAWTEDRPAGMRKLFAAGVDGIMTNYPGRLRKLQLAASATVRTA